LIVIYIECCSLSAALIFLYADYAATLSVYDAAMAPLILIIFLLITLDAIFRRYAMIISPMPPSDALICRPR